MFYRAIFAIFLITNTLRIHGLVTCDNNNCKLPDCLCMSTSPPNGLNPMEIPQLVFLTFDDAIADWMYPMYDRMFQNRKNPNGCPIPMTFYVTHDGGTNYQLVNEFFNKGNEIASHTVSHKADSNYWTNSTVDFWEREIGRQNDIIRSYANIPSDSIQGFRAPYLQTAGDTTFYGLQSLKMNFDSSLPTVNYMNPPIWPFTMDYGVTHDCTIAPCSTETHPGLWDIPMVAFQSATDGTLCSMSDSCFVPNTAQETFDYFMFNFQRYSQTRAPFGVYQHVYWFANNNAVLDGFIQFLDYLSTLDYVYLVTVSQGIEWIKNPLTLEQIKLNDTLGCGNYNSAPCPQPTTCYYTDSVPGGSKTMGSCTGCPDTYPWLD